MLGTFRRLALAGACLVAFAASAAACNAPPGLDMYRYEAMCRPILMHMHMRSPIRTSMPYTHFVLAWYNAYLRRTGASR